MQKKQSSKTRQKNNKPRRLSVLESSHKGKGERKKSLLADECGLFTGSLQAEFHIPSHAPRHQLDNSWQLLPSSVRNTQPFIFWRAKQNWRIFPQHFSWVSVSVLWTPAIPCSVLSWSHFGLSWWWGHWELSKISNLCSEVCSELSLEVSVTGRRNLEEIFTSFNSNYLGKIKGRSVMKENKCPVKKQGKYPNCSISGPSITQ